MQLIIYAHPDENSFNHAVLETVKKTFEQNNKPYKVIDLYELNYNPVLSLEELKGKNTEQTLEFQEMIREARNIVFIFPVWWFRGPAILEGFCDKVFTVGFSYHFKKVIGKYGVPVRHLRDKKVLAFISHGAPALPVKTIYFNAVKYRFLLGFLSFNFRIIHCRICQFWAVPFVSREKREKYLARVARRAARLR
ncbi:MAG: NAD(P)H-dependent oxidoreductase [Bacteroidota bacterium]